MIRFIICILLLLIALLTIVKAFEYHVWMLAIIAAEFCWVFMLFTLIALLSGFFTSKHQFAGTITGLIALALFTSPIVRAYNVAGSLKQNFTAAFGAGSTIVNGANTQSPFSFFAMFKGTKQITAKELIYNKYPGLNLTMDYFPSQKMGNRPCVVVVHGGSWNKGDNKQLPELNSYLASIGYNVAAITYRLAPKYQAPAPVEDIHNALAYLRKHANELNIDTNNFVLLGRSAGAQIALLAAYTLHEPGLKAVIDYYGPADMVWGYSIPSSRLIMDSRKVMSDYIGGTYQQVPQKFAACSPLEFVSKQSLPTLIIHGENDVLVSPEHSRRLNLKLQQNGIKHYYLKLPWATHGFDFNLNGPGGQLATYTVERFLNTVTK
ncbi:alpha/beta hydrolase [Mucilaginibacter sp. FT3.2]|uniref:alpha/beta hydrolase n=1 Tax=Mucilaginibacter sp. FT3.2 TaxID=2723090 RepID=UPI00160EEB23|nr:alpha/beta hydrolase [Mucilaginibacter sp. FT3.2]MBB6232185.1 acetyl esterase/lipase [Mucilaginibacter sp. FT3.2]